MKEKLRHLDNKEELFVIKEEPFDIKEEIDYYIVQLIRTTNLEFFNDFFVYLIFEFFYKVKVSIDINKHHKTPI